MSNPVTLQYAVLLAAERLTDATRSSAFAARRSVEDRISDLVAAVQAYRAGLDSKATIEPAAQTIGIGPGDTAILVEALENWDRYLTAPHADIKRILAELTGKAPS